MSFWINPVVFQIIYDTQAASAQARADKAKMERMYEEATAVWRARKSIEAEDIDFREVFKALPAPVPNQPGD